MNDRRAFLLARGGVLALPRVALAQQAERVYRLGWSSTSATRGEPYNVAFVERLRELGFAEGRNLVIEFREAKGQVEKLPALGFLLNPANHYAPPKLKTAQAAGRALSLTVVPVEVKGPGREGIDRAFATVEREHPAALVVGGDPTLGAHRTRIAELAIKHRLPTVGTVRTWADGGLLMAYGANFTEQFRRAATYVDRILKGAKPADLPAEQPTTFDLVINLKTAKALGVTVPPSLRLRANDVIQ